jgi:UDP-N-acetylglucosamine diphosphorylase/glucosamine-1-phosphate N-acetyltransferase
VTRERVSVGYNLKSGRDALLVNARARPSKALQSLLSRDGEFAAISENGLVAARTKSLALKPGVQTKKRLLSVAKHLERLETQPDLLFRGSWDLVESNGIAIADHGRRGFESAPIPDGVSVKGTPSNVRISESAEVQSLVAIDARLGPVIVDEGATVESFSMLSGPCYIGRKARVRSALVRGGTSVFESCRVGGEVENTILMSFSNKAHEGYLGDSIVGEWVNLGAGSTVSNLKNTYGTVRVETAGRKVDTGMSKLGSVIGDMVKASIGTLVHAGRKIGAGGYVSGLVNRDVPPFAYFDGSEGRMVELALDSVLETQRRMMERRGRAPSKAEEELLALAFRRTASARRQAGARKGSI